MGLGAKGRTCLPHDSRITSWQSLCLLVPLPVLLAQVGGQNIFLPASHGLPARRGIPPHVWDTYVQRLRRFLVHIMLVFWTNL